MLVGSALYVLQIDGKIARNTLPWWLPTSSAFWGAIANTSGPSIATRSPNALKVSTSADGNKLWAISVAASVYSWVDTLAVAKPTSVVPLNKALINLNPQAGAPYSITFTWQRPSLATDYQIFIAIDPALTQLVTAPIAVSGGTSVTISSIYVASALTPGTTYYWAVKASAPVGSGFSEIRSFTVQPAPASVPSIGSPINGGTIDNLTTS